MPVLNEERHIARSVEAMRKQRFDGELEFLVIDGGSTDRTLELLEELARLDPRVHVLNNPRRIAASGLNVGLRHATGRWVARMDAHTEYPDDYVMRGAQRLARNDTRWVSGPPIARGQGRVSRAVALALRTRLGRGGSRKWAAERSDRQREYELDSGVFAGVWERETLLAYGGWDESWLVNQDSEMAGRFLAEGEKLICLEAMGAWYVPRDSLRALWRQYLRYGEFREKTALRHPQTMRRSHLLAPGVVATSLVALAAPRPLRRVARMGLGLYAGALAGAAVSVTGGAQERGDVLCVPAVLAVMHFAHGSGALLGVRRYGPPLAALARVLGFGEWARRLAPPPERVFAPSLFSDGASGQQQEAVVQST
jgi:GT2 family glycosyltransferase